MIVGEDTIHFANSDSWVFLSIASAAERGLTDLSRIIGSADAINHAIPTRSEIEGSMTRLLQAALIQQDGRQFDLTQRGRALADRCWNKSRNSLKQWDYLYEFLESDPLASTSDVFHELETGEYEEAIEAYNRWFRRTLIELEDEERGEGRDLADASDRDP